MFFTFRLSVDDEYYLIAPLVNQVMETQISQRYNIGDVVFTEPHTAVLVVHYCLVGHCHYSAISL